MNYIYVVTIHESPAGRTFCSHGAYSTREEAHAAGEEGVREVARTQAIDECDLHYDILPVVDRTSARV